MDKVRIYDTIFLLSMLSIIVWVILKVLRYI